MPNDDGTAVVVLRRAGLEDAAKEMEQLRADREAAQPPPGAAPATQVPERVAELGAQPPPTATGGPPPPPGKAPLTSIADVDALSQQEQADRMPEIDWLEGRRG